MLIKLQSSGLLLFLTLLLEVPITTLNMLIRIMKS